MVVWYTGGGCWAISAEAEGLWATPVTSVEGIAGGQQGTTYPTGLSAQG